VTLLRIREEIKGTPGIGKHEQLRGIFWGQTKRFEFEVISL
jgi:hypothetical protein